MCNAVQQSIKKLRYFLCREVIEVYYVAECRSVEAASKRPLFYGGSCPLGFVLILECQMGFNWKVRLGIFGAIRKLLVLTVGSRYRGNSITICRRTSATSD